MILNKHKGECMCRELAALNAVGGTEHAQWILLSIAYPYVNEHKEFICRESASVISGESYDITLYYRYL